VGTEIISEIGELFGDDITRHAGVGSCVTTRRIHLSNKRKEFRE
jgi:hypothetical protein